MRRLFSLILTPRAPDTIRAGSAGVAVTARKFPPCEARDMPKRSWMAAGDAVVRLAWKLIWSWRR